MVKACLIIVFNHRFDKNIPVLEKIYGSRFSHIWFLVPFYDGNHPRVIPVYESSHYFQSFFAQGFHRFYQEEFTHYIFAGDDCILNPAINEHNVMDVTGLAPGADFLPEFIQLHTITGNAWWHAFKGIDFFNNRKGAEIKRELPSREEAIARFKRHGLDIQPLSQSNIFGDKKSGGKNRLQQFLFQQFHWRVKWRAFRRGEKLELPYPVAGSYSDIIIITKDTVADFCRYCGIMGAAGLFVEIAVPTALLLTSKKIMTEKQLKLQGTALWTAHEITAIEQKNNNSLSAFLQSFPGQQLFSHPVKLSKWKNDL